jgi:hypothetical protein
VPTLIAAFEVPPVADNAFLAWWTAARGAALERAELHRALREDVALRFVAIAAPVAVPVVADGPFVVHAAAYAPAVEDGTPAGAGGVVRIDAFEVPVGDDARFGAAWRAARTVVAAQRGALGTRLYRSGDAVRFRFLEVAWWSSPLMIARALGQPDVAAALAAIGCPSQAGSYAVVGV